MQAAASLDSAGHPGRLPGQCRAMLPCPFAGPDPLVCAFDRGSFTDARLRPALRAVRDLCRRLSLSHPRASALIDLAAPSSRGCLACLEGGMTALAQGLASARRGPGRSAQFHYGDGVAWKSERNPATAASRPHLTERHCATGSGRIVLFNGDPAALSLKGCLGPDIASRPSAVRRRAAQIALSAWVWAFAGTPTGPRPRASQRLLQHPLPARVPGRSSEGLHAQGRSPLCLRTGPRHRGRRPRGPSALRSS